MKGAMHGDTLAPADDHGDDTRGFIVGRAARDEAAVSALFAAHARPSLFARLLRRPRREAPAPVSRLLAGKPGEFTQGVNAHRSPSPWTEGVMDRRDPGMAHGGGDPEATAAFKSHEIPDGLITDPAPDPRPFAPEPATTWGSWDTPENREPMEPPAYSWDIRADFRDLPLFKSTVRAACKAGLRALGTRGVHPIPPLPDYDLDRFTVTEDGFDLRFEWDQAAAYVENDFYEADRIFHSAGSAGFRAVSA